MGRITRTFEESLAIHSPTTPDFPELRHQQIDNIPGLVNRNLVRAIDNLVSSRRHQAIILLNQIIGRQGLQYLGNGSSSSVYRADKEVIKIYRSTGLMTEEERQAYASARSQMCQSLCDELGGIGVRQTHAVETHPLGGYRVVAARQPYVDGLTLDLFQRDTLKLNPEVGDYCARTGSAEEQLRRVVAATFTGHDSTGLVPDINGNDNFRLVGEDEVLRLIDPEPIDQREHPGIHDLILRQAEVLVQFLDAA